MKRYTVLHDLIKGTAAEKLNKIAPKIISLFKHSKERG